MYYGLLRSGLNLRFRDPSLTGEMILSAILCIAFLGYYAGAARPMLAMFYMVALLFGALRLDAARLLGLAAVAMIAQGTMLWIWHAQNPKAALTDSLVDLAALAVLLPWCAVMGGYVNSMRERLSDSHRQLQEAFHRIEKVAIRDELTGLYNRRFLMEALAREHARAKRLDARFCVCLIDVDHFKAINDTLGHAAGDAVLKHLALVLVSGLRGVDVLGRFGGEEFLLILPDAGHAGAAVAAERVRAAAESAGFPQLPADRRVTVTIGVAASQPGESVEDLLARADSALYRGKAAGRNRVVSVG